MRAIALAAALMLGFHGHVEAQTLSDREIIALTLLGEARGEGTIGMTAVACVISNRAQERHATPARVCLQPKQFSCWNGGVNPKLLRTAAAIQALEIADLVLAGELPDITEHANHYCRFDCSPSWADPQRVTIQIRNHIFYRL